ncbi:MAG TPA: hypothetical protein VF637_07850 [Sphingomicrobium sp.]
MRVRGWVLASCAMLAACGGGGGGGAVTVVPGSPGPTATAPTPTPTPSTAALNTGEIKPTTDATYLSATMELTTSAGTTNQLTGRTTGGMTSDRSTTIDTPQFSGSYSPQTGYRLTDAVNMAAFGPGQLISDTTTESVDPTVLFARTSTPVEDYLALYKKSVTVTSSLGSGTSTPKYGGIGGWQHTVVGPTSRRTRLDYFAFGPATPVSAMPRSGVVKFFLMGSGNYATDTDLYFTSVTDTLTVNFDTGTVTGFIGASGQNLFTGGFGGLFTPGIAGSIVGNSSRGPLTSTVAVASGRYSLLFVGPNADELIITYTAQDGRGTIVGSVVGVRNAYLP